MKLVRAVLLLIVSVVGLAGCPQETPSTFRTRLGPNPVVSIDDRGIGLAAYADSFSKTVTDSGGNVLGSVLTEDGYIKARRFDSTTGFSDPVTLASGFAMGLTDFYDDSSLGGLREDIDAVVTGDEFRIAWQARRGRERGLWMVSGDAQTGIWNAQIDLVRDAFDPVFARGRPSARRGFIAWLSDFADLTGFASGGGLLGGYGSSSLQEPPVLLTRYGVTDDLYALSNLRTATGGDNTVAVWIATPRLGPNEYVYAAVAHRDQWGEPRRLATTLRRDAHAPPIAPAVDMDHEGNAIVVWAAREEGEEGVAFSRYSTSSDSWSEGSIVHATYPVEMDVAWNEGTILSWMTAGGGIWSAVSDVDMSSWTDVRRLDLDDSRPLSGVSPRVGIDRTGRAIVVWRVDERVYANERDESGWRPAELLGTTHSVPDLDVNDSGLGVAVWWNDDPEGGLQSRVWQPRNLPYASFVRSPDPLVTGVSVQFDARRSGGPFPIVSYEWDWEDDGTFDVDDGPVVSKVFDAPGSYSTRLRVTDSVGQAATIRRTVNIVPPGEAPSRIIVNYRGATEATLRIRSTQPGFSTVSCGRTPGPDTCSATVFAGYDVRLIAEYDTRFAAFSGWPCGNVTTSTTDHVRVDECHFVADGQDHTFDVAFELPATPPPPRYTLGVELHPSSSGRGLLDTSTFTFTCDVQDQVIRRHSDGGDCEGDVIEGTTVTVTAHPASGTVLVGWQGCDSQPSQTECVVTMNAPRVITTQFSEVPIVAGSTLTVQVVNGAADRIVDSQPVGINCSGDAVSDCSQTFAPDAVVMLRATRPGFQSWQDCDEVIDITSCRVTMNRSRTVTATYVP